jgi:hypothetical protein
MGLTALVGFFPVLLFEIKFTLCLKLDPQAASLPAQVHEIAHYLWKPAENTRQCTPLLILAQSGGHAICLFRRPAL